MGGLGGWLGRAAWVRVNCVGGGWSCNFGTEVHKDNIARTEAVMENLAKAVLAFYQNRWCAECKRIVNNFLIPAIDAAEKGKWLQGLSCDVHAETKNMQKFRQMNKAQFPTIAAPQDIWVDPASVEAERARFERLLTQLLQIFFPTGADKASEDDSSSIVKMATSRTFLDVCVDMAATVEETRCSKELGTILLPRLRQLASKHIRSFFQSSTSQLMSYFSAVFQGNSTVAPFREEVCGVPSEAEPAQLFHDIVATAPKLWKGQDRPTFTLSSKDEDGTKDIEIAVVDGAMAALLLPMCQHTTQLIPWMVGEKLAGADDTRWNQLVNVDMLPLTRFPRKRWSTPTCICRFAMVWRIT